MFKFRRRNNCESVDAYLEAKEKAYEEYMAEQESQKSEEEKAFDAWKELATSHRAYEKMLAECGECSPNDLSELVTSDNDETFKLSLVQKLEELDAEMKPLEEKAVKWWCFLSACNNSRNMWNAI